MSGTPDEGEFRNPPRAKPRASRPAEPGSTFVPNPAPRTPGAGKSKRRAGGQSQEFEPPPEGRERIAESPRWWERILFGSVSSGQLAQFSRQFAAYLHAGVDITRSLASLEEQFKGTALGPALGRMRNAIRKGQTIEEAMAVETRIFGPMYLSMMRVAEARGGVPETLKMLARHYESRQRLIRQARSAMIYPTIVILMASAVVALVSILVLPVFASILKDIAGRTQLPLASRALMAFSAFIQMGGWWLFPIVMIGVPVFLFKFYGMPRGKALMDRIALRIPVLGQLCRKLDTARFSRTMAVLLEAGLDMGSTLDLTADVVVMSPIRDAVRGARPQILGGKELSAVLRGSRQFYPDVLAVVASGEETGKLPETLNHLADDYDEQVSVMVKNLGQLVQPLVILMLGALVLVIILAVFLPIIQLISSLANP